MSSFTTRLLHLSSLLRDPLVVPQITENSGLILVVLKQTKGYILLYMRLAFSEQPLVVLIQYMRKLHLMFRFCLGSANPNMTAPNAGASLAFWKNG